MPLTRIDAIIQDIKTKIATVTYTAGTRLPSVRKAAALYDCSPSTVVEAYERLVSSGILYARAGAGFYVAQRTVPLSLAEIAPDIEREIDPLWVARQSLETQQHTLRPGCGWLPADWLYLEGVRRGMRTIAKAEDDILSDYATPLGLPALRQLLARRMHGLGIEANPAQIMLTESGTQALDLLCRFILRAGDTVLVDDPCYFNFYALLRAHRVKVIGVPYTPQGVDTAAFAAMVDTHQPRLYITNAAIHNPTGAILTPSTAYQVLQLAQQADMYIIEDDIFADFEVTPAPRLAALDGLSRVFYMGSFSKTISASLRCGYIAAPSELLEDLLDLKMATGFGGAHLAAHVVMHALMDTGYRKHMSMLHTRLARARTYALAQLAKLGITPWLVPNAGLFLWCQLPDGVDAAKLARDCMAKGVVLAPGNVFSQSTDAHRFMRFNVAQCVDARLFDVLEAVMEEQNKS
ncbi:MULTISPECIES: PLP-dependent aminotransferase family protein [unclassified Psychrobacter]|uniref:aminotransferase-like domain-containing protein n=1 Tax=unclassified Psychrobacter TaxID=196806 RepID=UPI001D183DF2|nr:MULTISPECIES: PLP-dependent aminotransferase family protein [unclassified Psychrobacter]